MSDNKCQKPQNLLSRYHKQRYAEASKHAEEKGYFFHPTKEALMSQCQDQNFQQKEIADFRLIRLRGVHLRVVGDIRLCTSLSICLLANNFLTKIDALAACNNIIRLDLHSNQLMSLPGAPFWNSFDKLQMLHLHDNPLGEFETIQILSSSPCLSILTLYDTPVSLKTNYRHHTVNTILTLKALDMYVVSDEEIIEDAVFISGKFTALCPVLRVDLCPKTPANLAFTQEMSICHAIIAKVNSILARQSPVLIIQRCLRGFLLRQKMGISKKLSLIKSLEMMAHPHSTPVLPSSPKLTTFAGTDVDYESYIRKCRPGSVVLDEAHKTMQLKQNMMQGQSSSSEDQDFIINVQTLKSRILACLHADTTAMDKALAEKESLGLVCRKDRGKKKQEKEVTDNKLKSTKIKDIKQFFGPMVPTFSSENEENEISLTDFRLKGRKPELLVVDATTEMILSRKEAGQMVRQAEAERMRKELMQPPEREKAEQSAARTENILGLKEEKRRAKDRLNRNHNELRAKVLKSRDLAKSKMSEELEKQELQRINFIDRLQEHKIRCFDFNKVLKADHSFMQEFISQQTSVSNALQRYDHQAFMEDNQNHRQRHVSSTKKMEQDQQIVLKKYLEHQKSMRRTEIIKARTALNAKIQAEATEKMIAARNRVAHQRARQVSIIDCYLLPYNTVTHTGSVPVSLTTKETSSEV